MSGQTGKATRRSRTAGVGVAAQSERADMFTKLPGKIVSFDPTTQTATVMIMTKPTINGQVVTPPLLQEVPVLQNRGGGFAMTAPLGAGDWVDLSFDGEDTSGFRDSGAQSETTGRRLNSLSDAVATPGRAPATDTLPNYDAVNMFVGTSDGKSGLRTSPTGKVELAGPGGVEDLISLVHDLLAALAAETTTVIGGSSAGVHNITNQGTYAALQARVASMKLR